MMMINLTLPVPPSVNTYWRRKGNRYFISQRGKQYKADVHTICMINRVTPLEGKLKVTIDIERKGKRDMDIDNHLKALLDSLAEFAYYDDAQITELHITKSLGHDEAQAFVRIEVIP